METATALAMHALAFWAFVFIVAPIAVTLAAWMVTYSLGAGILPLLLWRYPTRIAFWPSVRLFFYSFLIAAIFFVADTALTILGPAFRPRQPLPVFLGGLELYYLLFPGVAAVALGLLAASIYADIQRTKERTRSARGT